MKYWRTTFAAGVFAINLNNVDSEKVFQSFTTPYTSPLQQFQITCSSSQSCQILLSAKPNENSLANKKHLDTNQPAADHQQASQKQVNQIQTSHYETSAEDENLILGFGKSCILFFNNKSAENLWSQFIAHASSLKSIPNSIHELKTNWEWISSEQVKQSSPLNEKIFEVPRLKIKCFEGRCQVIGFCDKKD